MHSHALGQPTHTTAPRCLSINLRNGLWSSNDCFLRLPFICLYAKTGAADTTVATRAATPTCPAPKKCPACPPRSTCPPPPKCPPSIVCTPRPKPPPCPSGWTYLALTSKCYKVAFIEDLACIAVFQYFNGGRSGFDAVTLCIGNNAVLTSIHSYAENSFLTGTLRDYSLPQAHRFLVMLRLERCAYRSRGRRLMDRNAL